MKNKTKYFELLGRIRSTRRKETLYLLIINLLKTLSVLLLFILCATLIEMFAKGDTVFRGILFFIIILSGITSAAYFLTPSILRLAGKKNKPTLEKIALRIGNVYPDIKDKLCNVIQLMAVIEKPSGTSPELALAAFSNVSTEVEQKDFNEIIDNKNAKKHIFTFAIILLVSIISFLLYPNSFGFAFSRIANWNKSYVPPPPFTLSIEPKSQNILRDNQVKITVNYTGIPPGQVILHIKEQQQEKFDEFKIKPDSSGKFVYEILSVKNSIEFYGEAPWFNTSVLTETGRINIIDKPIVRAINGRIIHPSYTGLSPRQFNEQAADISALKGSLVDIEILANKELDSAYIVLNTPKSGLENTGVSLKDSTLIPMKIEGRKATTAFKISESGSYYILIVDKDKQRNEEPIKYSILALKDSYPVINLIEPSTDVELSENAAVPVKLTISDDYGFSGLKLNYRLVKSKFTSPDKNFTTVNVPILSNEIAAEVPYLWDLQKMNISPEDQYEFYFEVFDNDIISGPKSSKTQVLKVRLPSLEEVLHSSEDVEKKVEKDLQNIMKDAIEAKKDMEDLNRELMKKTPNQPLDWKEKKKAEEILKKQSDLKEKLSEIQKNLEQATEKLQENKMMSPETLQKFQELQKLLQEVNSPELQKAQKNMEQALKNISSEQMQKAIKEAKFDEDQFKKSIERTMKILKRLKVEQKVDALTKLADELQKKQEELEKQLENANPNDENKKNDLANQQKDLKDKLDDINKELKDLEKLMKDVGADMPQDELDKAKDALDYQDTQNQMQEAKNASKSGDFKKARQAQKKAKKNVKDFADKMKDLKKEMEKESSKEAMRKMEKAISDMLELSKDQEELKQQSGTSDFNSTQIPKYAQDQSSILESLINVANAMMELSEKSFAVTSEMGQQVGNALRSMQNSMEKLAERNVTGSTQDQNSAMTSMNNAIMQMQDMLSAMQKQGGGTCNNPGGSGEGQQDGQGGMSFSERLQQIAGQQQAINSAMKQLSEQGSMSSEQQAEFGRAINKQGNAQKSLDDLAEEQKKFSGDDKKKTLGNLEKLSEEMKEVMSDLKNNGIRPETLKRQEKILSRLLDATKSINERDFEKNRESKSGKNYSQQSPQDIDFNTQEGKKRMLEELMKSNQQGYSKDYEELIRLYFEALQSEKVPVSR